MIHIKRIYEVAAPADGYRVLVDRLWPRGVSKERAAIDTWANDIAPSPELRTWFGHDPQKFAEFSKRYTYELEHNPATAPFLTLIATHQTITLLYGAKDPNINHAIVLREYCQKHQ